MKKALFLVFNLLMFSYAFCQPEPSTEDTIITGNLAEVVVRAYEQNKRLQDVPAAISYIGPSTLNRYNNTSILPALNTAPGVKMEERSPGSYRLSIRGSSLRSPFGVRNVKIYYDNIPFTDPGGNTYLNQLGFYNIHSLEVIKGPGSSLYGSGTGGVLLIESASSGWHTGFNVDYSGSYNLQNINASVRLGTDSFRNTISFQHQASDGYRMHSQMKRDVFSWNTLLKLNKESELSATFLYSDLFYETPGALTLAEYNANPKAARPSAGALPGAEQAKAAIYQRSFFVGATYKQSFNDYWQNITSLYGAFTRLLNPTFRNYGRNHEPHFGGRTVFRFQKQTTQSTLLWHTGAEVQQGFTTSRIYNNVNGNPGTLQTDDEINNRQAFVFTQVSWQYAGWTLTAGLSLNQLDVQFTRLSTVPVSEQKRRYNNELAPRVAILKKVSDNLNVYGSISKGFSPPTSAELLPGTGEINTALNAEHGINYETGIKGSGFKKRLYFDVNAFFFRLQNTIVQRRDATGGEYFINAGSTRQNGLETYISYKTDVESHYFFKPVTIWLSHTWNNFHYKEFRQLDNDFSGKQLPGIAPHTIAAGLDVQSKPGIYANLTYYYSDPMFLNDANDAKAGSYTLLGARVGYKTTLAKHSLDVYTGADNLFNVKHSLGNDINSFGGRYYNAAAGINYFAGISFRFN